MAFLDKLILKYLWHKTYTLILIVSGLLMSISCSLTNEDISTDPALQLRFSTDTVFFDTIFSEIPSITKRLRVYNDNSAAVSIASIALAESNSAYELTVNGRQGKSFSNVKLLSQDSMLVLVDAFVDSRDVDLPFIVEDKILFSTNGNNQEVSVFSWGQDANYIRDSILVCNTTWTAGRPYVIFDNALVDSLCTLTIAPGVRVFSHLGAELFIKGSIRAVGTPEERITFSNNRFDGDYQTFPGQWGGITFLPGSKDNEISFTDIRNAEVGVWLGTPDDDTIPDLIIENSVIENMSNSAVLAFTSDLTINNSLLDNSGGVLVGLLAGGNYTLNHNTIANYGYGLFKSQPSFYVTNQLELSDGSQIADTLSLAFNNCIVWGTTNDEIVFENDSVNQFKVIMTNNLLRTQDDFFAGNNNILNVDPLFIAPVEFDYQLEAASPALKAGADLGFTIDLLGLSRTNPPDIGSYERQQ